MSVNDDECISCKSSTYVNPNMKLLSAPCGHKYCETCVDANFKKDQVMICIEYDSSVDKENSVRKNVLKVFNKRQDNFPSLLEYNNYLEMIEDIVFQLLDGGDEAALAKQRMKEYERMNQQSIAENKAKKENEDKKVEQTIEKEQQLLLEKRNFYRMQDQQELAAKQAATLKTMNDLAEGKISAKDVREIDKKNKENEENKQQQESFEEAARAAAAAAAKRAESASSILGDDIPNTMNNNNNNNNNNNKFTYQVSKPMVGGPQPVAQAQQVDGQQAQQQKAFFSLPAPLEHFKYDELALKNLIPTQAQSDAAGFKQIHIKQRAFEEAFGSISLTRYLNIKSNSNDQLIYTSIYFLL
ncbi:CDK-activating kinase assembly factor MAT1 [Heterostelium album PN500]|uniref:CDK-activating kinase assembly factor MAT1 n=1 Tax=Heterostelium pallidum (strain ATCC 26659 / Pp 5 / PN500) TaxID=670386 RepID=D3BER1_HETP5|nr:CDK-activating kinase assembly factor MAT1 [Heterostelium album PN500]EFA80392.1 CDK-activating kinase assembly factor MAT1 [Heterostelium album PN500]|eukprot:XP_020432512.1 CDK-activating kinase assembly factor MAT1 [Heterostelium album PN500]